MSIQLHVDVKNLQEANSSIKKEISALAELVLQQGHIQDVLEEKIAKLAAPKAPAKPKEKNVGKK